MATRRGYWTFSPHSGGTRVPAALQLDTRSRIEMYADRNYSGLYLRIDVRFRGALCYIDAFTEPAPPTADLLHSLNESREQYLARRRETPTHLCRLRYFAGRNLWSMALYTYSNERFEPCVLPAGEHCGTPEECFDLAASFYLGGRAA